jgi:hypothetical protein
MVYSGFSPFVGAGTNLGGWSFAVDISKGKQELGGKAHPEPFEVGDLYAEVCSAVSRHGGLGNVAVEDKLCVNGQDIRGDVRFLPELLERPRTRVEQAVIDSVRDNPTANVRHYKQIRILDWGGELVFSCFLRFAKLGHSLFIEMTSCLLTPVHDRHRKVDAMNPEPGIVDWVEMGTTSFVAAVLIWWFWPLWLLGKATGLFVKKRADGHVSQTIRKDPTFDRGAFSSIREYASSPVYQRYFQKLDKEMYVKILQQQIIDVIVNFLDARGIDTTELKERQTSIVNSGVIVSGDLSVQGENVAFGSQAQAVKRERSRAAQAGSA